MSTDEVNQILIRLAVMDAKLDTIGTDNSRGEQVHQDHEQRIRSLERVRWAIFGFGIAIGGGSGAALTRLFGA